MSQAAVDYVQACTHPKVKGGTRALFTAIAELVPDGQTTTPPLTVPELAAAAQYVERTTRTCRDVLVRIGEIKVHDGGQGSVARYEMVRLGTGARPMTNAPLPLRADLRPVTHPAKKVRKTSAISADVDDL